ncbi:hypothetical protein HNY73_015396 [Argiope bruennichi]|uniref:Uncharacterized protein n=1 Tax=Argiope bruennichi TaxID=94029 RepID=A0A8T0ETD4_ARGBR|nr:hypothetical protein HNY73_015396 [Argiope bruennichi]
MWRLIVFPLFLPSSVHPTGLDLTVTERKKMEHLEPEINEGSTFDNISSSDEDSSTEESSGFGSSYFEEWSDFEGFSIMGILRSQKILPGLMNPSLPIRNSE